MRTWLTESFRTRELHNGRLIQIRAAGQVRQAALTFKLRFYQGENISNMEPAKLLRNCLSLLLALTVLMPVYGQEQADIVEPEPATESDIPEDAFGRGTPRRSIEGFLRAAESGDWDTALHYIDLRSLPPRYASYLKRDIAWGLAVVIQRKAWLDLERLSDSPDGTVGDDLPPNLDELGRIEADGEEYVLLMQRLPRKDGDLIWKVSNTTVADTLDLYQKFGYGPVVDYLADRLPRGSFLGVEYFKWALLVLIGLAAYAVFYTVGRILARILGDPSRSTYRKRQFFFTVPVALFFTSLVMIRALESLGMGITAQGILQSRTGIIILLVWVLLAGASLVRDLYAAHLERKGKPGAVVLLRPATRAFNILIVLGAILVWLDNIGFNITTLLAGLGVGGVAVALALQKPLEDVFGALSLYTQQPIRIGDFCRIGPHTGTIEEIGLRTTRLRTLANTVLSIPNAKLAVDQIDNYSARQKILYNPRLRLRLDTSREQLQRALQELRDMVSAHQHIVQSGHRVRFRGFADDALDIEIFAYLATNDFATYLEYAEDVNLRVMESIEKSGASLALPARAVHREG